MSAPPNGDAVPALTGDGAPGDDLLDFPTTSEISSKDSPDPRQRTSCQNCGNGFTPRAAGRPQVFCSPECRRAYHDGASDADRPAIKRGKRATFETEGEAECLLNPPAAGGAFIDHRPNGGPLLLVPESELKRVDRIADALRAEEELKRATVHKMALAGATPEQTAIFEQFVDERIEQLRDDEPADFDWSQDDSVVAPEQRAIAVYENNGGGITIRQEAGPLETEDSIVFIARSNLQAVIDKLCDLAGIGSAGRQS